MKKITGSLQPFYSSVLLLLLSAGCMKDKVTRTYQIRTPIYEVLTKFRESIVSQPAVALSSPGKITEWGKYLFVSEPYKGIHVIDNSNPSAPKNISFINIPGNEDMAVKNNTLYADAYGDLISFDITDPGHAVAKNFATNVFPDHQIYYLGNDYLAGTSVNPDSINIIIGWNTRDTTVDYTPQNYYIYPASCFSCASIAASSVNYAAATPNGAGVATNGSTARFSIINNFLYTVSTYQLTSFDISQSFSPSFTSKVPVDYHVETIYPLKDKLFVGTNNGMYMYDVLSSPGTPALLGSFTHVRGCDPVVADDKYAYVTINDSSACLGFNNELQIVDIESLGNSYMVRSYQLVHPVGLSKDNNNLFICDGKDGLKVFNVADVNNIKMIAQLKDGVVYDVIAENGLAIVLAGKSIYQYDYSDLTNIHLISKM